MRFRYPRGVSLLAGLALAILLPSVSWSQGMGLFGQAASTDVDGGVVLHSGAGDWQLWTGNPTMQIGNNSSISS